MSRVFVGMSGGVDSSLAAALLVEQGHDVVGVYMKNWTQDLPGMRCPWADDLADAKRVAVRLGIPLRVYDFQTTYRQKVVDYMIAEYRAGRTPSPDIMCNQEVKFKLFLETAIADGADMIATGHYARVEHAGQRDQGVSPQHQPPGQKGAASLANSSLRSCGETQSPFCGVADAEAIRAVSMGDRVKGRVVCHNEARNVSFVPIMGRLFMAADTAKDQTYFLYRVTAEALGRVLFPLGDFASKNKVRAEADRRGLVTARKPDSQGICFVGSVGVREFLSEFVTTEPGPIVDSDSHQVVGQHDGALFYTIGQRHGLNVGGGLPYYVVNKSMDSNTVLVSRDLNHGLLWRSDATLCDVHWINESPKPGVELLARLRHGGPLVAARIDKSNRLSFTSPQRAIAPGQSAVLYDRARVVGGGIIV